MRTIKNNKAATSISTLLLVVMALVLCAVALFAFLTSQKANKIISDARFIENAYVKEQQVKFLIKQVGEIALKKTEPFDTEKFKANFKEEFNKYEGDDVFVNGIKTIANTGDYKVEEKGNKIYTTFEKVRLMTTKQVIEKKINWVWYVLPLGTLPVVKEQMAIIYETNIVVEINKKV